jgi:hypothetical protein
MGDGSTDGGRPASQATVVHDASGQWLAGVFAPLGLTVRPEIAAISMSGSSILVAVNALLLKRLDLPPDTADETGTAAAQAPAAADSRESGASGPRRSGDDAVRPAA